MNMNDYLSSIPSVIQENIAKVVHREKLKVPHLQRQTVRNSDGPKSSNLFGFAYFNGYQT